MIPAENQQIVHLTELNNHIKKRTARMAKNLTNDHISSKQSFCSLSSNSESNRTSRGKSKSEESDCRGPFRIGLFGPDYIQNKNQQNKSH
jgi:predicted transcriptional regulator